MVVSGLVWIMTKILGHDWMVFGHYAEGIDLVYLPAGIRLLCLMVGGAWAALGIALANPLAFHQEFQLGTAAQAITDAVISGFAPYMGLLIGLRIVGIGRNLAGLKASHLPILALSASVVSPLLLNILFVLGGAKPMRDFPVNFLAMVFGDFVGSLVVVVVAYFVIEGLRLLGRNR